MREWEELILSHIKNMLFYLVFLNVNIYIFNTTIVMIDDKKIEEAAQGAADLYEQDLPIMSYNEDTEVDGQHHFCQEFGAELFKDGAKWAINEFLKDLWHPISEEPDVRHKTIICLYEDGDIHQDYDVFDEAITHDIFLGIGEFNWNDYAENEKIMKWCYATDLVPKEGGNHD